MKFVFKSNALHARIRPLSVLHWPYSALFPWFRECPAIVDTFATIASPRWVATLQNKPWDKAVEDRAIVIAIEAMLEKIPTGKRCLLRKKFEANVARSRVQNTGSGRLWLEVIDCGHFRWYYFGESDIVEVLQVNEAFREC
jgi:hypothetical protein